MSTSPAPDNTNDKPSITRRDRGERIFVRIVCGECGARTRPIDTGERFEIAATPNHHDVEIVQRRVNAHAFERSLVQHHLDHAAAVSSFAAVAVLVRAGLYAPRPLPDDIGPLVVLLCESKTMVSAWPRDTRLRTIEMLFDARDPNPLAQAVNSLRDTWAVGRHVEVATRAMQWWSWRPVTREE